LVDQPLFRLSPSPERGDSDNLFRMMIEELEPFFRRIVGRQHFALSELRVDRTHQIVQGHAALLSPTGCNHAIDGPFFRPLNDGSQNRATDQIAPIEDLILSISEPDRQKPILIETRKNCGERMLDKVGTGLSPISAVLIDPLPIQRQIIREIHI
jgi:hypothetical protein